MSAKRGFAYLAAVLVDVNNIPRSCSNCFYRAKNIQTGEDVCTRTFVYDSLIKGLYYENTKDAMKKCQGEQWMYDYE